VCLVEEPGTLEAEVELSDQDAAGVERGQAADLRPRDQPRRTLRGRVDRVAPRAVRAEGPNPGARVTVYCRLEEAPTGLRPGAVGHARITRGRRAAHELVVDAVLRLLRATAGSSKENTPRIPGRAGSFAFLSRGSIEWAPSCGMLASYRDRGAKEVRFAMKSLCVLLLLGTGALALSATGGSAGQPYPPLGTIERLDPTFDELIAPGAYLEKLDTGFQWTEGPVWVPRDGGYLLFSDIPRNSIFKWQEGKGTTLFLKPSGYTGTATNLKEPGSNALLLDPEGRLVMMEHGDRRVSRLEKDGKTKTTLAHLYEGKRLNSPNDGAFKSNGDLYFTDPPYGRMVKDADGFPDRDLDFCGVYRLSKDGKLTLLTKEMTRPNGICFSPDEKTLYVANSDSARAVWMAFDVKEDGTLGAGRVFYDVTRWAGKKPGLPDGMKVDRKGNLFATGPGGVLVFTPAAKLLGVIATGVPTSNCNWGDDGSVLYVTADKSLTRIRTKTGRK
jgi:gluconolactonase